MTRFKQISIHEVKELLKNEDVILCDVRDFDSFEEDHHHKAIHLSDFNLLSFVDKTPKHIPIIVVCYHGNTSQNVAQYLIIQGFKEVYSLDGGYEALKREMILE